MRGILIKQFGGPEVLTVENAIKSPSLLNNQVLK